MAAAYWIYGKHAVRAALANPARHILRLATTRNAASSLPPAGELPRPPEILEPAALEKLLPPGAVHQGLAAQLHPLAPPSLEEALDTLLPPPPAASTLLLLDQVSDPHNLGAILRSAAAFGADALLTPDRHSPHESAALAKAASGALETLPWIRVTNLAQAMTQLQEAGYWCAGLDGHTDTPLPAASEVPDRLALVLGAEGKGLRRLTAQHCDMLWRLPISNRVESLNVSNAAAVALFAVQREKKP